MKGAIYIALLLAVATPIIGTAISNLEEIPTKSAQFSKLMEKLASLANTTRKGGNIFVGNGDKCNFKQLTDPAVFTECETLETHMLCSKDGDAGKCACLEITQFIRDFAGEIDEEAIEQLENIMKLLGVTVGTAFDGTAKRCALMKNSMCPTKEIDLGKLFPDVPGLEPISDSLNKLKCGTNLECGPIGIPDVPAEVGKCVEKGSDPDPADPECEFAFSLENVPAYLKLCNTAKTNEVCYPDNTCACFDAKKILAFPQLNDQLQKLKDNLKVLEGAGLSFSTSYEGPTVCNLSKKSACPLKELTLGENFNGVKDVEGILNKMKCRSDLVCKAIDIKNVPQDSVGECASSARGFIAPGFIFLLGSIFALAFWNDLQTSAM